MACCQCDQLWVNWRCGGEDYKGRVHGFVEKCKKTYALVLRVSNLQNFDMGENPEFDSDLGYVEVSKGCFYYRTPDK